jgi:hypothetical protein
MPKTIIENANGPVSAANPLPVTVSGGGGGGDASAANQVIQITDLGGVTETAPATDTGSSGLNGRMQRVAQRLTSLIAQIPATLGQKTKSAALAVTLASDEDLLALNGAVTETAPATDTASSGLNGRLQRIAQRLTSLIALVPASLGQKTKAASLAVALASDDDLITVTGTTADAVVAAGAVGTVSAKLRRLTTDVAALLTGIVLAAGTNRIGTVGSDDKFIEVVPTLDTAAYVAGDVFFIATQVPTVNVSTGRPVTLMSVMVVDKDDQGIAFDLHFFDRTVTFGTINVAPTISDADAALTMGYVSIGTNDYKDLGGARVACVRGIGLEMKPNTTDLYISGVIQGGGTYTASGMTIKLGFLVS